ncbi:MAG: electron transfer flavoprotein subunit alpha/FixB family protein, partial [Solirubrobacteraceae bacterium]
MSYRILIIAEHDGARLNPSTAKCVTCAAAIPDAQITVAVCAADASAPASQAAALKGVTRVLAVDNSANAHLLAAVLAPQIVSVAGEFTHVLGPSTTFGKDLMPRIAALLDTAQISDIMAVESATRFRRPIYAGNVIVTVEVESGAKVVGTVRTASFAAAPTGGSAPIEKISVTAEIPSHTRFVSVSAAKSERPDLQTASRVVSG